MSSRVSRALARLRPGTRRRQNPDGTMTLVEHLYELRNRLAIALVAIALTTVFGYVWFGIGLFGTPSLGELLKAPYCAIPADARDRRISRSSRRAGSSATDAGWYRRGIARSSSSSTPAPCFSAVSSTG